jgi:alkylation response protein AidB-like acyl-CoA dehydrogenase
MNFELTEDQKAYQEAARQFAEKELAPHAAHWDQKKIFPKDVIRKAAELGFGAIYVRDDVGGSNLKRLDAAIIFEELAAGCPSTTAYITIHNMVAWMIDRFGSEALRQEWLPKMATCEVLGSYCLTEPNSGSDAASLKTRAEKKGDKYVLTGTKAFVSGGGETDVLIVMARTGDESPKGISSFVVPTNLKGISYGENEKKMGWNSQPTRIINFDQVEVPAANLLGDLGQGFKIAMMGLDGGRINIATCSVGAAQAAINAAQKHMLDRKQFGKPLADFQALQFRMADMVTELVASRQMVRLAAAKLDAKDPQATVYCAMAKRFATDFGHRVCDEALQLFGGYGYTQEYPVERLVRDTRVHRILEGTNEIMRVIVARKVLEEGGTDRVR